MKHLKRLLPYLKKYKRRILSGFLFVTLSNVCSTYVPRIVGSAVDRIQTAGFQHSDIYSTLAIILSLTVGSGLFMYLTRYTIIVTSRLIEYDLRRDFLEAIEKQSLSFYQRNPTGTLMALANNDIVAAREFLGPAIMYGANTITTFIFALYFMISISLPITLLSLAPLPIIAVVTYFIGKKIHFAFDKVQAQFAELSKQAQETFSGIRVIKSYNREFNESDLFKRQSKDYLKKNLKLAMIYSLIIPFFMVLTGLSQLFVLGYGGLQVLSGSLSLGGITQFFIYLGLLIWPVAAIGWITNIVQRAAASMARLSKVLDDPNGESQTGLGEIPNSENGVGIEFRNVMMSYDGDARSALNDISIEIPAGTSLGITGSIGSGKTAFVNLIPRLFEIFSGQVLVNGVELSKLNPKAIRSVIGFVPQEPFLFSMSIADNVRFSKPDATNEEIEAACKLVELHSDVEQFPDRYNTILGERGITLSGGQKQRLAIARAILKNPAVLILDDALSAVDTQTEEQLLQNLRRFMTGRTSIIISHRISTIMHSDRIMTLLDGRIAEYGTHLELLANNGIYANLYNRQQLEREIETFNGEIQN